MPPVKPSAIRDRPLKRRTKGQRAGALLGRGDAARVDAVITELTIAQLQAQPTEDRATDYEDLLDASNRELELKTAKADAIYAEAELVLGRKIGAKERKERRRAVLRSQADVIERNLDAWEGTLVDHEANLIEAEVERPFVEGPELEELDARIAADENAIAIYERSIAAGEAKLAELKADPDYDKDAPPPPPVVAEDETPAEPVDPPPAG